MGDGKLSDEEKQAMADAQVSEEKQMLDIQQRLQENEAVKKVVTLEQLMKTRIDPTEDRVLVWPDPIETVYASGLVKAQETVEKERPSTGTVLAVGPGKVDDTTLTNKLLLAILENSASAEAFNSGKVDALRAEVNRKKIPYAPGDHILYGKYAGTPTEDPETKATILIMRPDDIFAKV